jgi:lysophospholipase L1-like esterase
MKRSFWIFDNPRFIALWSAMLLAGNGLMVNAQPGGAAANAPSKWEPDIQAFERMDRTNPPPQGAVLFLGSSSIRMWKTLAEDMDGIPTVRRGFGGSRIADSTALAERIVFPYKPRMIVFYAGDNDIAAKAAPDQILADFKAFVQKVHALSPDLPIAFISIKPSMARWERIDALRVANALVRHYCESGHGLKYIDVYTPMVGDDGKPLRELFESDLLHLNGAGYKLWTRLIRPQLESKNGRSGELQNQGASDGPR